jgi:hypothetical protein
MSKKKYIRVPPELGDGDHYTFVDHTEHGCGVLGELLWGWLSGCDPEVGETVELSVIEMTDEEVAAIPEI